MNYIDGNTAEGHSQRYVMNQKRIPWFILKYVKTYNFESKVYCFSLIAFMIVLLIYGDIFSKDILTLCHIIMKISIALNSYNIQWVWHASLSVFDQNIEN